MTGRAHVSGYPVIVLLLLVYAFFAGGCAAPQMPPPKAIPPERVRPVERPVSGMFVAITVKQGDTFSSLAESLLGDPRMGWLISDFNGTNTLTPGQELIVPLGPYERGGIYLEGYQTVPVLSYHKFSNDKRDKMTVTTEDFEKQMRFLKDNGYSVITMDQLFDFLEFSTQIPKKSVVITIDDGWRSAYEFAFPILKKYGYPATLFIYTDLITGSKKTLNWDMIREMSENGLDIQCHTKTHRNLTEIGKGEPFSEYFKTIVKELTDSARIIKAKVNRECRYLAYPYGETNSLVNALLKKHGYRGGFTVKRGGNPSFLSNFTLYRSMIYGEMDLKQFESNLEVFTREVLR